jgi:quercetin dioxygenase-like cupin family protein
MESRMPAWDDLEERTIIAGFHGRFIHGQNVTLVKWHVDAGSPLPPHSHHHEQVVLVSAGELEMVLEGERHLLRAGDVLVIPPNAQHEGLALTDVDVMDVFAPVREDYRDPKKGTILGSAGED